MPKPRRRKILFATAAVAFSFLLSLGSLELLLRVLHSEEIQKLKFARRFGLGEIRNIQHDPELGWRTKPGTVIRGRRADCIGQTSEFENATDQNGFRFRTNPAQPPDILIIGDSMLQADGVDDPLTLPALLSRQSGLNIWAYGCKGYGTTQEWLWLKASIAAIQPKIVLLMFCPNDFINNLLEWEQVDEANNNLRPRPYLSESGEIQVADPSPREYHWAGRSEIGRTVYRALQGWQASTKALDNQRAIEMDRLLNKSKIITAQALQLIKSTCQEDQAWLYTFYTHEKAVPDPLEKAYRQLAADLNLNDIKGMSLAVDQACLQANGPVAFLDAPGGHWNAKGHELVAGQLHSRWLQALQKSGFFGAGPHQK